MTISSTGLKLITIEFIVFYSIKNLFYASSQSCSADDRNFTAIPTELLSLTSPGYNESTGTYENDMDCWWIIDSGDDSLQLLIFLTYDISCPGDSIALYDSAEATSTLFSNCGTPSAAVHYSTTQRYLRVEMKTDSSTVKSGFKLEYLAAKNHANTGCTAREDRAVTEEYQYLSSPNFPNKYPSNSNCRWNLAYSLGTVEVNVIIGDIEDATSCDYDKYQIYDGEHRCDYNRMTVVCNEYPTTKPYTYTSNDTSVVVAFESDGSVNRRGFLLRYRGIPNPTTVATTTTTNFTSTTNASSSSETESDGFTITAEMLLGLVFGSLGLISFTIITTVCIVMKLRVPLEKTISTSPIKTVKSNQPIKTISRNRPSYPGSHSKPVIMNGHPVTNGINGVSRRITAW